MRVSGTRPTATPARTVALGLSRRRLTARAGPALCKGVASELYRKRLDELGALPPGDEEMSAAYLQEFVPSEIEKFRTMLAEKK